MKLYNILFLVLITGFLFSCGDDDDSETLVGDWVRPSYFDGANRSHAVALVIEDTVYVVGGYDGDDRLRDVWKFDPSKNVWTRKASINDTIPARTGAVGFAIGKKGYFGTGFDGDNRLKDFWEFDPSKPEAEQWSPIADFEGTARYGAVAFAINGKGYVATGYDGTELRDLWEYNPESNDWTAKTSMPTIKRYNAVAFVIDNKAYVCTGIQSGALVDEFAMYDPATDTWTKKRNISNDSDESYDDSYSIIRQNAVAFVIDGKGYVTCGSQTSIMNDTWEYNPTDDLWTKKSYFEGVARTFATSFNLGNRGFVLGGQSSSAYLGDIWEFKPNEESDSDDE